MSKQQRKVWVLDLPEGLDLGGGALPPGVQVMIEQWDDQPPSLSFRRDRWSVWGRPRRSEVAP